MGYGANLLHNLYYASEFLFCPYPSLAFYAVYLYISLNLTHIYIYKHTFIPLNALQYELLMLFFLLIYCMDIDVVNVSEVPAASIFRNKACNYCVSAYI
jgi:hypothetical protein